MTIRSVILGLLAAVVICGVTFFNDMVMDGTPLIGNFVPIAVFGTLLVFVLVVNPVLGSLLAWLRTTRPLTPDELARSAGSALAGALGFVLIYCYASANVLSYVVEPHWYDSAIQFAVVASSVLLMAAILSKYSFVQCSAGLRSFIAERVAMISGLGFLGVIVFVVIYAWSDIFYLNGGPYYWRHFGSWLILMAMCVTVVGIIGLVNRILRWLKTVFAMKGREVAVAAAIALFACYIPGRGLMHYFTTFLMFPHHHARNDTSLHGDLAQVQGSDVNDWSAFSKALREATASGETPLAKALARRLDKNQMALLADALKPGATAADAKDPVAAQAAVIKSLNKLLKDRGLANSELPKGVRVPHHVKMMRDLAKEAVLDGDVERLKRAQQNELAKGTLLGKDVKKRHRAEWDALATRALFDEDVEKLNRGLLEMWLGKSLDRRTPGVLEDVPSRMLADIRSRPAGAKDDATRDPTDATNAFMNGIPKANRKISFGEIPWHAWQRTFLFWIPLILTISVAVIALAVVVHRQWSSHEHLPYPTIEFAKSLLPNEEGGWNHILRNRLFWLGSMVVLAIYLNNYMCAWWPKTLIPVTTKFDFGPLVKLFPTFERGGGLAVGGPTLYFVAIGFAYFLSTEVSFSLGIGTYAFFLVSGVLAGYGIRVTEGMWEPTDRASLHAGAYFGIFLCLIYTGRHYYLMAARRTLFLRARDKIEPHVAWAGRVFLVCAALFVVQLTFVGVEWQMAILYLIGLLVIYVVISRLLAEAGVFFISAYFLPCAVLWGAFGPEAGGSNQIFILALVSSLLVIDPRETLMPFVVSSLKLADGAKVRLGPLARWGYVALFLGFAVAVPVTLYWQYQEGAWTTGDNYTQWSVPYAAPGGHKKVQTELAGQGRLQASESISGWKRVPAMSPMSRPAIAFAITFGGVLLFAFLRNRFAWWPLHPIIFVVLGTYQSNTLAFSILAGWLLKVLVVKYGGSKLYVRLKPLVIGVIAGEILGAVIPVIVGGIYYAVTGELPKKFTVLP